MTEAEIARAVGDGTADYLQNRIRELEAAFFECIKEKIACYRVIDRRGDALRQIIAMKTDNAVVQRICEIASEALR